MLILLLLAIFVKGENKWAKVLPNGMRLLLVKFLLLFAMCPLPGQSLTYNVMHGHSKIGWLSKTSCRIYIVISFLAVLIMALSFIKPLETVSFFASILAIPFLISYFVSINLLRKAGNKCD